MPRMPFPWRRKKPPEWGGPDSRLSRSAPPAEPATPQEFVFDVDTHSIVLEVDGTSLVGQLVPALENASATLQFPKVGRTTALDAEGWFEFEDTPSGAARVSIKGDNLRLVTPTFIVGQ